MAETVAIDDLITYERMAEIVSADVPGDVAQRIRRWRSRGIITPVREDLTLFRWSEVRPILAERFGKPEGQWADQAAAS